ncbi:MAG TPA: hypothetical protein VEA36_03490 [Candidatus Paceibacterota bacterium]|nr:hypothetical protein [Candidatus Paceibacterota bacterium]
MDNLHPQVAKRVGITTLKDGMGIEDRGILGVNFYSSFTSANIHPSIEDRMLTVGVRKSALGELYLILKQLIEESPREYGFEIKVEVVE